jgi:eukaryotic-like serine/threonine-protein kinase
MDLPSIQLGPFALHEPIARGAAAEVWRATHVLEGVPVAIKVMGLGVGSLRSMVDRFEGEVRAVASLNHEGVVAVLDHGVVGMTAHRASGERLPVGAPWLAMEYCSGGTLADRPVDNWREAHDLLVRLLEALAYTHARGVLHRDIKPRNVLFADWGDSRPGVKLTDFGLATASVMDETMSDATIGTPNYMAPEQVLGHWRDFGPATDLYALGCLAWRLFCGSAPFQGKPGGVAARLRAHVQSPLPEFFSRFAAPALLVPWLRRLLAKSPEARFAFAADALAALPHADAECVAPVASPFSKVFDPNNDEETLELEPSPGLRDVGQPVASTQPPMAVPPIVPQRWSALPQPAPSMRLIGAGLGLFALRSVAFVGREPERARLWSALHRTAETGQPMLAVIEGAAGVGKTRLADWLVETAHELGAADCWRAQHQSETATGAGVAAMVAQATASQGLRGADLERHLEGRLKSSGVYDPYEWLALAELIEPVGGGERPNLEAPVARYAVIQRLLLRCSSARPLIVVLDEPAGGGDALRFAAHVLQRRRREACPVLFILTLRSAALGEADGSAEGLGSLLDETGGQRIQLAPLEGAALRNLVEDLLGLEGDLAAAVEGRSGGNPLFAVQLVGDWVERGVLEIGETGFRVREGADVTLPDDLHHLWIERVGNALEGAQDRWHLECAAVLGVTFSDRELRRAVKAAGQHLSPEWFQRCGRAGLLERSAEQWHFGHRMLHESLLRCAADAARLEGHHRCCAAALEESSGERYGSAERLAVHRLGCGEHLASFEGFARAATSQHKRGNYTKCAELWSSAERALILAEVDRSADHWGRIAIGRATLAEASRPVDEACVLAREVIAQAEQHGWLEIGLRAELVFARERELRGDAEEAERLLRSVLARAEEDGKVAVRSKRLLAWCLVRRGLLDAATVLLRELLVTLDSLDDPAALGAALRDLAVVSMQRGEYEDALFLCAEARKAYGSAGLLSGVALANSSTGEIYRMQGRYVEAEKTYRKVRDGMLQLGNKGYLVAELNMGLAFLGQKDFGAASKLLERSAEVFEKDGQGLPEMVARAGLSVVAAADGDAETVAEIGVRVAGFLAETGLVEQDIAWCFELAAGHLSEQNFADEARVLLGIATDQWSALGRRDRVAAIAVQSRP